MQSALSIQKYKGRPCARTLAVRPGRAEDIPALLNLVQAVLDALPDPRLFVPTDAAGLRWQMEEGLLLVLWDGDVPAAYVSAEYPGQDPRNYGHDLGVPAGELEAWANLDTTVVHPDYRGNGLQQRMIRLAEQALRPGIRGIACTVSPHNPHSLANVLACGYTEACRKEKYGGYLRVVLKKELACG